MKFTRKTIGWTITGLLLIATCFLIAAVFSVLGWIQTYNAFTQETLVAEVEISELKEDNIGPYVNVTYKPVASESPLTPIITGEQVEETKPRTFKIYGDTVVISGPFVKLHNELIMFNFNSLYKVTSIYGVYNFAPPAQVEDVPRSSYPLNGGADEVWRDLNDNENIWPYSMFVDETYFGSSGEAANALQSNSYQVYATQQSFIWRKQN